MMLYVWFEGGMSRRVIEVGKEEVLGVDSGRTFELKLSATGV